jgi:hypothetical protein
LRFRSALLVACIVTGSFAWSSPLRGTILVKVTDQGGHPVAGATVDFNAPPGRMLLYSAPECETNSSGECSRNDLLLDTYYVTAMKTSEGYPDLTFNLYGRKRKPVVVQLTAETLISNVSFVMGPKCGMLAITAMDEATGTSIPNPRIMLQNPSEPGTLLSTGQAPGSKILIPPDEDITVEVSADGYKPWHIDTQPGTTHPNTLRLHSEESRQLTVRLQPQAVPNTP